MIDPPNPNHHFRLSWQQQLASAFTRSDALLDYLGLSHQDLPVSAAAHADFAFKVPLAFAENMVKGDPHDPLLRQVLPISGELQTYPGFGRNPVGDLEAVAANGVLHKYQGRVLLVATGACAINCRYCFRRSFPYAELQLTKNREQAALDYIAAEPSISEVILSGGDPLLLSDPHLSHLLQRLNTIPHIRRIRIHSRLPIVLPARITPVLLELLGNNVKPIIMVVHCNHANELGLATAAALKALKQSGLTLLNQSVLLKAVNDRAETLCELSEQLFNHGVLPYYLHFLDQVEGAGHFAVDLIDALEIMAAVKTQLPGYLVPKFVKEQAGAAYKLDAENATNTVSLTSLPNCI